MRQGENPSKKDYKIKIETTHRIIISVYIPNLQDEYFKNSSEIFCMCLDSVLATIHSKTRVSIILNGCCDEVNQLVYSYQADYPHLIDQVYYTQNNLGKINAIYSIVKSNLESLLTITDADVMFLPNWQSEVEKIFVAFPEAGMVSPVPSSKGFLYSTASTLYYGLFKGKIKFRPVLDPDGLINFQESVGSNLYQKIHLEKYLVIENNGNEAVVGCGHFVGTFRMEVFEHSPTKVCQFRVQGGSEEAYLDDPNDLSGRLRLATLGNFAYHLGNTPKDWMRDALAKTKAESFPKPEIILPPSKSLTKWQVKVGRLLFILLFYKFRKQFFKTLGVNEPY
ncbi:MAG: glycosyltransferase family 2 protein [Cyclobacteriaceae bacterium]|nr:glycosyltransferase family 2 protein [Cyclobacteriaceae bacterium]MDX5465419.1 glycosyltransferase family 2 protein [Cyclobacteriaceae bacterium]